MLYRKKRKLVKRKIDQKDLIVMEFLVDYERASSFIRPFYFLIPKLLRKRLNVLIGDRAHRKYKKFKKNYMIENGITVDSYRDEYEHSIVFKNNNAL